MKRIFILIFTLCLASISQAQGLSNWTIGVQYAPGFYWKYNKLEFNHPGIIAVKPKFSNTHNIGVSVYRNFNDKWQFKIGIEYSKNNQKFIASTGGTVDSSDNYLDYFFDETAYLNIYYVSMPFQMKYILFSNQMKGWSIFTEQGFRISYLIDYYQEAVSYIVDHGVVTDAINGSTIQYYKGNGVYGNSGYHFKTPSVYTQFVVGYTGSVGFDKRISNRFNATSAIRFDYDINNVDNPDGLIEMNSAMYLSIIPAIKREDMSSSHNIRALIELGIHYNLN